MKPVVTPEEESYRFGPGEPRVSTQRWHVPIGIGGKNMVIKTPTLEDRHPDQNKIPWLAGQDWLRFMGAVVDVAEQKIYLKAIDAEARLHVDHTLVTLWWPWMIFQSVDGHKARSQHAMTMPEFFGPQEKPTCRPNLNPLHRAPTSTILRMTP